MKSEANVEDLRNKVVSDGTMRPEDLIPKFLGVLKEYAPDRYGAYVKENPEVLDLKGMDDETLGFVVEELFDELDKIAPEGCIFGASDGDGACYGFWDPEASESRKCSERSNDDYLQEVYDELVAVWDKDKFDMTKGYDDYYECNSIKITPKDAEDFVATIYVDDFEGRHPTGFDVVYHYPGDKGVGVMGSYEFQSTNLDEVAPEIFEYFDDLKERAAAKAQMSESKKCEADEEDAYKIAYDFVKKILGDVGRTDLQLDYFSTEKISDDDWSVAWEVTGWPTNEPGMLLVSVDPNTGELHAIDVAGDNGWVDNVEKDANVVRDDPWKWFDSVEAQLAKDAGMSCTPAEKCGGHGDSSESKRNEEKILFKDTEIPNELKRVYNACKKRFYCEPNLVSMVDSSDNGYYKMDGSFGSDVKIRIEVERKDGKFIVSVDGLDETTGYHWETLGSGESENIKQAIDTAMAGVDKNLMPFATKIHKAIKGESKKNEAASLDGSMSNAEFMSKLVDNAPNSFVFNKDNDSSKNTYTVSANPDFGKSSRHALIGLNADDDKYEVYTYLYNDDAMTNPRAGKSFVFKVGSDWNTFITTVKELFGFVGDYIKSGSQKEAKKSVGKSDKDGKDDKDCKGKGCGGSDEKCRAKKSESLTLKQKELKDMVRYGEAEDITTLPEPEAKELYKKGLETVGLSRGTYGLNGALLRDSDGKKYAITARSSNLFYFI